MKGFLYIENDKLGEVDFKVIDESMGAVGGDLVVSEVYDIYKNSIQNHYEQKGISNIIDYNFKIILDNVELQPLGIGVTHSRDFDNEIYVEVIGLDETVIQKLNGI